MQALQQLLGAVGRKLQAQKARKLLVAKGRKLQQTQFPPSCLDWEQMGQCNASFMLPNVSRYIVKTAACMFPARNKTMFTPELG